MSALPSSGNPLRHHRDFRNVWFADTFSVIGTRLNMLAMPLLAVLTLNATTFEVSLLRASETLASLLLGLVAGAWMDRVRCRPVMVAADLARFVLLLSIPVAALAGVLSLPQLYLVAFTVGVATVFFNIAATTYLPRLLSRGDLIAANSALATNTSVGAAIASGAGGFVIELLTAPITILVDSGSFLWSALWLKGIRTVEETPARSSQSRLRREIGEGLRFVAGHPVLRALAGYSASTILFQGMYGAINIVFLVKAIGLGPGAVGLVSMSGLLGAIASGFLTGRMAGRLGAVRTLRITALVYAAGFLLFPLTRSGWGLSWWIAGGLLTSFTIISAHILHVSVRQGLCPRQLYGRVGATMEFMVWGIMPIGSLLGGIVATLTSMRTTLWIVGAGVTTSMVWIIASPLRTLRDLPTEPETEPARQ
jgi:MFS family permease